MPKPTSTASSSRPQPTASEHRLDATQGSVFVTGQQCSRSQRRGRYTRESVAHPAKMLPSIARYLIATFTQPGEWVCDPMAGIGTTVVEAAWLGRHGVGVEYEPQWAALATGNVQLAKAQGVPAPVRS